LTTKCTCDVNLNRDYPLAHLSSRSNWETLDTTLANERDDDVRIELVQNIVVGLPTSGAGGEILPLVAVRCDGGRTVSLSTKGMEFRGNVLSKDGKRSVFATINWNEEEQRHHFSVPAILPSGSYNVDLILLHVGGQAINDPPCMNNLTLRTHCAKETRWFSHFSSTVLTIDIVKKSVLVPLQQQTCGPWVNSPGMWRQDLNGRWKWHYPPCRQTASVGDSTRSSDCVMMGDSTFSYLHEKMKTRHNNGTCSLYSITDSRSAVRAIKTLSTRVGSKVNPLPKLIIYNTGLHGTCYGSLAEEVKLIRPILQNLTNLFDHVVVRSTVALTFLPGLDFQKDKCIYYTERRLLVLNAETEKVCRELNIPFWDVFAMTASSFPFSVKATTDGTHYCKFPRNEACHEEMRNLKEIVAHFLS
jgi:hypothetical protein